MLCMRHTGCMMLLQPHHLPATALVQPGHSPDPVLQACPTDHVLQPCSPDHVLQPCSTYDVLRLPACLQYLHTWRDAALLLAVPCVAIFVCCVVVTGSLWGSALLMAVLLSLLLHLLGGM